jgi:histidine triad (HIT) family protein
MEKDCIFCDIVAHKRPADIVYEDEVMVVFKDIKPYAPVHLLIVPRKHIRGINDLTEQDREIVAAMIMKAPAIAAQAGVKTSGYRLIFNVERGAGQVVFHLHMHLIGG